MNLNRIISFLCLLLFFTWEGSVSHAADSWSYPEDDPVIPYGGGTGTQSDPYQISTVQHLANLAYMVNNGKEYKGKYFVMTNDITLNENVIASDGKSTQQNYDNYNIWKPIGRCGYFSDDVFHGTFDGRGHTVKGMVIYNKNGDIFNGLFGTVEEAVVKNIHMEDCYIQCDDENPKHLLNGFATYGFVCGIARNSTFTNCTVSGSFMKFHAIVYANIGGIVGQVKGGSLTRISNCAFDGNFKYSVPNVTEVSAYNIGGIVGEQTSEETFFSRLKSTLHINNCSSSGSVEAYGNNVTNTDYVYIGGIGASLTKGTISNCVSSMNIAVNTTNLFLECLVGGISCAYSNSAEIAVYNCAYFGTISIGNETPGGTIKDLRVCGIGTNSSTTSGCAFYGKFDIHGKIRENGKVASIANVCFIDNDYRQNVVYSVGNVIDLTREKSQSSFDIDPVCNSVINDKKHRDYYHFEVSDKSSVDCKYTENNSTYAKELTALKADGFIAQLNKETGKSTWGKLEGMSEELNGLPLPIGCGGVVTEYAGTGAAGDPWILSSEADLIALKAAVNNGTDFSGKYIQLGSDIRITGTLNECIGSDVEKPFKGHLDGKGHAIIGLRKSLFGYMYGTVKNLALVDCNIWDGNYAKALARQVGDTDNKAEVSNRYISGTISFNTPWNQSGYASTFAFQLANGSSIHDCYFKGRFVVKATTATMLDKYNVAGIAFYNGNSSVTTSGTTPQGIYNCYASFDVKVESNSTWSPSCDNYGICYNDANENGLSDCYFVSSASIASYNSNMKLSSESELNGKFNGKTGWLQGVYRPVLAYAKKYAATTPEKNPEIVYFDAIPEANPKKNYFYNISIDDPYSDVSLWQLPNMAVYVPNEKKDYITNGYLDQSADFQYNRSADATATAGQLRYDLTQTDKGYHMICLPGVVERDDLPDGAKVMIIGKIQKDGGNEQVNVVMVDTIPAGVPCMLYVPTTTVTTGTTIPLVMRSGIVSTPTVNATYSDFKGTFSKNTNVPVGACTTAIYSGDNNTLPCFVRNTETTTAEPFTAWLEGATGDVQIVDYILLDEENKAMTVTLSEDNAKNCNIKMRRALKKDDWNTICLPYSLTSDEISPLFGCGTKVETFSGLEYNSGTNSYTMKFSAAAEITAGTPYFIKPSKDVSGNIYDIKDRTITCTSETYVPTGTSQTANNTTLTMQGEYNKRMITPFDVTESENIYVISGDKIYHVNSDVEMKGFRCYFVAKGAFSNTKVIHSDGTSTDLRLIDAKATGDTDAVYDLLGRKRDAQTKGLVIKNGIKVLK